MNAILRALRPTAFGLLLFALGLLAQAGVFSVTSLTYSFDRESAESSTWAIGPGGMIALETDRGAVSIDVRWGILLPVLLLTYAAGLYLARILRRVTALRHPATAYGLAVAVSVGLALLVAITLSKMYWGYFLQRPPVPRAMGDIARVASVTPVFTVTSANGARSLAAREDFSFTNALARGRDDPYYCLDERLLLELDRRDLLPEVHSVTLPADLPDLFPLIRATGLLAEPEAGYEEEAANLGGVVIDAVSRSGRRLVVLGLGSGQVENDHYPYYEMVFSGAAGSPNLSFAGGQRFFYDVAGLEGFEWYVIWPPLSLPAVALGLLLFTVARVLRRRIPPGP